MSSSGDLEGRSLDSVLKTKMPALGIDLGGTKLKAALVCDQKLMSEPKRIPTPRGADKIIDALLQIIAEFRKDHLIAGVGIATAGIVDFSTGQVIGSTGNLPGWEGTRVKALIEGRTMLPVVVENDANAAAYGEFRAAGLENKSCIVAITVGTGIGGGIILNGKLHRGAHWAAGEVGHLRIALDNRRLCTCGLWDCWESFAAGRGLVMTCQEILAGMTAGQSPIAQHADQLTTDEVVEAAFAGDIIAGRAMSMWHEHLCAGLVTLAHTLDPDCFVVSGGMSEFIDFGLLRELLSDRCLPRAGEKLEIHQSVLGMDSGLIGAAQLLLDSLVSSVGSRA